MCAGASPFAPLAAGGHQERERRAGTENVRRHRRLRRRRAAGRGRAISDGGARARRCASGWKRGCWRPGRAAARRRRGRLPGTLNVGFAGAPGQLVAAALDSKGSACRPARPARRARWRRRRCCWRSGCRGARRRSGAVQARAENTEAEIDRVAACMADVVARVRGARVAARVRARGRSVGVAPEQRVVVAMSGGVDSSAAAALLVERGYEVIGVTLRLYDASGTAASIGGRCCGPRDIEDARATAALLGIAHHVIDESAAFRHGVIDEFVAELSRGPHAEPVRALQREAQVRAAARVRGRGGRRRALATGHYARIAPGPDGGRRAAASARSRQGPVVFPVRRPARPAVAGVVPARRA